MTHELAKLNFAERLSKAAAACERLQRAADMELTLLTKRLADIDKRLTRIEDEDARWRSFMEAAALAPIAANFHPAPKGNQ
jgi:hypothetical protein